MKYLLLTAALLAATPVAAGGPVIVEEAYDAPVKGHSFKDAVPFIILGLVVAGLIAGGGNDVCTVEQPQPEPTPDTAC